MNESLLEYTSLTNVRIDRDRGVIYGVKVLGAVSRNNRTYTEAAMRAAIPMYEGAKVNVNHPKGSPGGSRDYQDRIGAIRNVTLRAGSLFGDLHYNPKHAVSEQLAWDAANNPSNVGLSHNIEGQSTKRDGKSVVEAITKVVSVDLVADPATTKGLFESQQTDGDWCGITVEQVTADRPDLVAAVIKEHEESQDDEIKRLRLKVVEMESRLEPAFDRDSQTYLEYIEGRVPSGDAKAYAESIHNAGKDEPGDGKAAARRYLSE